MKKIYTLIGALMLIVTAASAGVKDFGTFKLSDEGMQMLSTKMAFDRLNIDKIAERPGTVINTSYTDNNGVEWNLNFSLLKDDFWYKYLSDGDGNRLTSFDDFPYYMVQFILYNNETNRTYIPCYLCWPSKQMFYDDLTPEEANEPLTINDLIESGYNTFTENGYVGYQEGTGFLFLSGSFSGGATVDGSKWYTNYTKPSTIQILSFVLEDTQVNAKCNFNFMNDKDPSTATKQNSKRYTYDGPADVKGFQHLDYKKEVTEVHIFKVGEFSSASTDLFGPGIEFGPFMEYYVAAACKGSEVVIDPSAKKFDSTKVKFAPVGDNVAQNYNWFFGPVFSAENSTEPTGVWTCLEPELQFDDDWELYFDATVLKAGSLLPSGYNDEYFAWCVDPMTDANGLAFRWVKDAYYYYPNDEGFLYNGTTNGFGYTGNDQYGDTYYATFNGQIIYHPNPDNIQETQPLKSVGEIEVDAVEEIAVEDVNAPVRYFNLQGVEVVNPAKGQLLIKTQGSKATKVIL